MVLIYVITNSVNGKYYIGQTRQLMRERMNFHLRATGHCRLLSAAIKKYGRENFACDLLAVAMSTQHGHDLEKAWIAITNANNRLVGYNLSSGGDGGGTQSEETKALRASKNRGQTRTREQRDRFSAQANARGQRPCRLAVERSVAARIGNHIGGRKPGCIPWNKGRKCTAEESAALSLQRRGRKTKKNRMGK